MICQKHGFVMKRKYPKWHPNIVISHLSTLMQPLTVHCCLGTIYLTLCQNPAFYHSIGRAELELLYNLVVFPLRLKLIPCIHWYLLISLFISLLCWKPYMTSKKLNCANCSMKLFFMKISVLTRYALRNALIFVFTVYILSLIHIYLEKMYCHLQDPYKKLVNTHKMCTCVRVSERACITAYTPCLLYTSRCV